MNIKTAKALLRYAKQYMDLGNLRVGIGTGWCYMPEEQGILIMEREDEDHLDINHNYWYMGYIETEFNLKLTYDEIEIFSLFHELGHHMNGWIDDPEVYRYLTEEVGSSMYDYRQIPDERKADEFAVEFIREHYTDLVEIYNKLN